MLRLRRYRVFLFFAGVIVFLFVRITRKGDWPHSDSLGLNSHNDGREKSVAFTPAKPKAPGLQAQWTPKSPLPKESFEESAPKTTPPPIGPSRTKLNPKSTTTKVKEVPSNGPPAAVVPPVVLPDRKPPPANNYGSDELVNDIQTSAPSGGHGVSSHRVASSTIYWKKQSEQFPVPTESLIPLPTGKPVTIPKIQHDFDDETTDAKISREKRQTQVKQEFLVAWNGYKKYAWLHDELSPVSGKFRDPFCGWAATLVDTLDTLWIMGLEDEFEEAVDAVKLIDFTTSFRKDIPMFETTIRYLGGLLAAYDVSGGKYKSLLTKAVELAEVLMGAFDTPNRMPMLYYKWAPASASQPHRASARSNLAELGSLSLEFTRLAQLTKDPRYYDAIARVTNALSEWQDRGTSLYGVFPEEVDASGCNRTVETPTELPTIPFSAETPSKGVVESERPQQTGFQAPKETKLPTEDNTAISEGTGPHNVPGELHKAHIKGWDENHVKKEVNNAKRQLLNTTSPTPTLPVHPLTGIPLEVGEAGTETLEVEAAKEVCKQQGLVSTGSDKYSMGGGQDSTYEYFPKQYLLLGGLDATYSKMFNLTMNAVRKHMVYRPMVPDNRDILFTGSISVYGYTDLDQIPLTPEVEHLTCFIGGMVGMGAKIFGYEGDLELAKKLTDGCVWAYESTASGIMPEGGNVAACTDIKNCVWNETSYHLKLDPVGPRRDENVAEYIANKAVHEKELERAKLAEEAQQKEALKEEALKEVVDGSPRMDDISHTALRSTNGTEPVPETEPGSLRKRQANDMPKIAPSIKAPTREELAYQSKVHQTEAELQDVARTGRQSEKPLLSESPEELLDPAKPPTHAEYVASRIKQESLPPGYTVIRSRKYILRPEAIESVWYMYRITGDKSWQDKGWKMFTSIINATSSEFAHAAILDVTQETPYRTDEMESFWLAGTLRYFYLLYSTPDTISLDDYVLNTEAHPFLRPSA